MKNKQDGGPAFPTLDDCEYDSGHVLELKEPGMSLRDWFAGKVLSGMTLTFDYSSGACNASVAERAYAIADAMLAERLKQ